MSKLALKLIQEAKETRATRINLGKCGISVLPDELFDLVWLEELVLGNVNTKNRGAENSIKRLPDNFKMLHLLEALDMADLPLEYTSQIASLKRLKVLNLSKTAIKSIVSLRELVELIELDISLTNVKDLGSLTNLKNLQILNISQTEINDLNSLRYLKELKSLDASSTKLRDIKYISELYNLQNVDVHNTALKNLDHLGKLSNLKTLNIRTTDVLDVSPLCNNFSLENLNLSNTKISDISSLQKLNNLQQINLQSTLIRDIEPLRKLSTLQQINLSSSFVENINPLQDITNLQVLNISSTRVNNLNPLRELSNLKRLLASSTYVSDLSPLKDLPNLEFIVVNNCPLVKPPIEIASSGSSAILNYLKQIKEQKGTEELYEAKLIIVGEGATGKTTLFEKLKDPKYQLGNTLETHGINIHEGLPFRHELIGENVFNVNLWDFGGQELQYMTHQFFLTPRGLYILMMDARRESPNLAYWFKIISLLGRDREDSTEKVRLLLVFNKRGNSTGQPQYQDQLKYYEDNLDIQYLEVDFSENDYRFENLQKAIQQSLVTLPIVKSQLPRLWKTVREDLRTEAQAENYISTKRFSEICSKYDITEEADQWLLSGYLHQLGSLLHFQNDKGLRRLVILRPQWAVDGVYTFLSEEKIVRNYGRFTEEEFMQLLAARNYSRDDADVILQLMTKNNFDICYEATSGNYVASQLLPDNAPDYQWFPKDVLPFRYQYPIMPKGLMSRLIVRLSDDIWRDETTGDQVVWKKGVILLLKLREGECRVRLREDDAESKSGLRQILIDVMGDREARKFALRKVRDAVDDLHKRWFRSIKPDEMVPCCCPDCSFSDSPQLYKLNNILRLRSKGDNLTVRCFDSGEEVSTKKLLEGVYAQNEINSMGQNN